jgi:opacity protein-like surface antigen
MKRLLVAAALAVGLIATPASANWFADAGVTNSYDGYVRVRDVPNGNDIMPPLGNGVPVHCYERATDAWGQIWTHVIVGNAAGWSRGTSLTCSLYGY